MTDVEAAEKLYRRFCWKIHSRNVKTPPWPSDLNLTFRGGFIRQNNYPLYPGHPFRTQLLRAGARMLCEKDRKRDSDTEQRIHYFDGVLPFPVIQSFGKNVLWEKRKSAIWHKAKNLLHWWHFTAFLFTVIDPSRSFRMTTDAFLIIAPCRPRSFWMNARMPYEKAGKRNSSTEWRIYYSDDILRLSSPW